MYWGVELLLFPTKRTHLIFDVGNNNIQRQQNGKGFSLYKPFLLKNDHTDGIIFWCTSIKIQKFAFFVLFFLNCVLKCAHWNMTYIVIVFLVRDLILDFDQMWFESKDNSTCADPEVGGDRGSRPLPPWDLSEAGSCVDIWWVGEGSKCCFCLIFIKKIFPARSARQYYT